MSGARVGHAPGRPSPAPELAGTRVRGAAGVRRDGGRSDGPPGKQPRGAGSREVASPAVSSAWLFEPAPIMIINSSLSLSSVLFGVIRKVVTKETVSCVSREPVPG